MKRLVLLLALWLPLAGCSHPAPGAIDPTVNLSPTGKASYQALRVGKALDVLRDVAVAGEKQTPKVVSSAGALKVIAYHRQVVTTMAAIPDKWLTVAEVGLDQLRQDLSAAEWARIAPFVDLLRTLYTEWHKTGGTDAL